MDRRGALSLCSVPVRGQRAFDLLIQLLMEVHQDLGHLGPGGGALGREGVVLHAGNQALMDRPADGVHGVGADAVPVGELRRTMPEASGLPA